MSTDADSNQLYEEFAYEREKVMQDWEVYEDQILEHLKKKYSDYVFKKNDHVQGRYSKVDRQIDISIRKDFAGSDVLMVVECKCINRNVDVKVVDSFIGFLEDVNAKLGVIVTKKGYSEGAKNRAEGSSIRLDVVSYDDVYDYDFDLHICQECDPGDDRPPPIVHLGLDPDAFRVGRCSWCNTFHFECPHCGVITAIPDYHYDEVLECEGGCGLKFRMVSEYVGSGMTEERFEIIPDLEQEDL